MLVCLLLLGLCPLDVARSEPSPEPSPSPAPAAPPRKSRWTFGGDLRLQPEVWSWFTPASTRALNTSAYTFLGARLRGKIRYKAPGFEGFLELQDTQMLFLPTNAIAAPPAGQLGTGGTYYATALRPDINTLGVHQGWLRFGKPEATQFQVGRVEYFSGLEVASTDPIIDWLKSFRIAQKLFGGVDYSNFGRAYDGARLDVDTPSVHLSGFVARPTQVEPHFSTEITKLMASDVAVTLKQSTEERPSGLAGGEFQAFWSHYDDRRKVPEVDDRPAPLRGTIQGEGGNSFDTYGFHYVTRIGTDGDGLLWFAHQTGKWGKETHDANAFCAELGVRAPRWPWKPWFRVGFDLYSGDNGHPGQHGTFVPQLLTQRLYSRTPFFTLSNLHDTFGQVVLLPRNDTRVRLDVHRLSLDTATDLWYNGTGALQNQGINGFVGRPSGGSKDLGNLVELSIDHNFNENNNLIVYLGQVAGGAVVKASYPGSQSANFIEAEYRLRFP